jgi:uncharacterized protein (TIGR03663 family)
MNGRRRRSIFMRTRFCRTDVINFLNRTDGFSLLAVLLAVLAIAALVLRFKSLDGRGIHLDEAIQAYWSWWLVEFGSYEYQGQFHGPLLYYLSFPAFLIRDSTVTAGREVVAIASMLVFPGLFMMRRVLHRNGVLFAAAIFALHPIFLWTARFYRSDMLTIVLLLLAVAFYYLYRTEPSKMKGTAIGILLTLAVSTTEISYLWVPLLIAPLLGLAYGEARAGASLGQTLRNQFPSGGLRAGTVAAVLTFVVMYSGWPPDPLSAPNSAASGIATWVNRSGASSSSTYYLERFITTAPVLTALAAIGLVSTFLQPKAHAIRWMFISWLIFGSIVLSLVPHQTMWLQVHILMPLTLVASFAVVDILKWIQTRLTAMSTPLVRYRNGAVLGALLLITVVASAESYQYKPLTNYYWTDQPKATDNTAVALRSAAESAIRLNCDVLKGPDVGQLQPVQWFLKEVTLRGATPEEHSAPGVWINWGSLDGLKNAESDYTLHKNGPWWVYVPLSPCK